MFIPKTKKINDLANKFPNRIQNLKKVFNKKTNIYIDYANVFHWQEKLGYHIDFKRLKQLFESFDTINQVKIYQGELKNDIKSKQIINDLRNWSYIVRTKPVKVMKLSIDVSSIQKNNPAILKDYINKSLLSKLDIETIEFLNTKLSELNAKGTRIIRHLKCNFDVEMSVDMIVDSINDKSIDNFVLWSGDSDFADVISQLILKGKNTAIFATARRISTELEQTGSYIFDLKKIKDFICWKREC
jgi:uncharacterized LabA/DUF88 family protein